jgi:2-polyprenyl-6-methoxyphenol hydroxylase-like FAD-dependent oxidoreductase
MADAERVLIVGGGIAGLTLAAALHRRGFKTEFIERNPTWQCRGRRVTTLAVDRPCERR